MLKKTQNGRANLQIWRGGRTYERQKGTIYRGEWNNILFTSSPQPGQEENVLQFDVRQSLPYPDRSFDAVFALHIVEHLTPIQADSLLKEIFRVLKPTGVVRLSTPDLEDICKAYLNRLDAYDRSPTDSNLVKYEWSVLELLDQIARVEPGGLMKKYIRKGYYDPDYSKERFGDVFESFNGSNRKAQAKDRSLADQLRRFTPTRLIKTSLRNVRRILDKALFCDWDSVVSIRNSGEVNKWLYDHYSLTMLVRKSGFCEISRKTHRTSDIPDWESFDLDRSNHGEYAIEPSLYIEGRKPSEP